MASLGTTFDANAVEPNTPFEVLPAGKYHVQIVSSERRDNSSTPGWHLRLELSVMDGQHANKRLFERLNLVNQNEKAVEIAQRTLSAICRATGIMAMSDSEQLHNKSLTATVRVVPAGPDKGGVMREAQNQISGYEPLNSHRPQSPAAPAAQNTQPAWTAPTSAVQAKAEPATPPWRRAAG